MLTVKEINEVSFGKAGFSGYKPEDVDRFIDEVAASFEQLEAERNDALKRAQELATQNADLTAKNAEIQEKLGILAQKIEAYREDEDGIKDALISAQRMGKKSVEDAKGKAELILQDAKDEAASILDNAKVDASRAAKEYMAQAEEKKAELEEMKRQVSAFRSSLMEMYKKHLECIDHIPVFKSKERAEEPSEGSAEAEEKPEPEREAPVQEVRQVPVEEPAPKPESQPAPQPAPVEKPAAVRQAQPVPAPVNTAPDRTPAAEQPRHSIQVETNPERRPQHHAKRTLHDRVDFTKEEDSYDDDLSDVGIDLKTYSSIPESLRQEKDSHYSHLEFGEDVDLGGKKRKK